MGLVNIYSGVRDTLQFYSFEQFKKTQGPYVPTWVRELYRTYNELVPNGNEKNSSFRPVKFVMVLGKDVRCNADQFITALNRAINSEHTYKGLATTLSLDDLKVLLDSQIYDTTPRWIAGGDHI